MGKYCVRLALVAARVPGAGMKNSRLTGYPGPHRCGRGEGPARKEQSRCQTQPWLSVAEVPMSPRFPLPRRGWGGNDKGGKKK